MFQFLTHILGANFYPKGSVNNIVLVQSSPCVRFHRGDSLARIPLSNSFFVKVIR